MRTYAFVFGALLLFGCGKGTETNDRRSPNILVILVDDMGYSDIGCFGSELATPHLDSLAAGGARMVGFYNTGRCCPSRAALLTGQYPHRAGIGMMERDWGHPSYRGFISEQSATIAEVFNAHGYISYHVGKWHVGPDSLHWPRRRGFDRHFSFIHGAGSYYNLWPYRPGGDSTQLVFNHQLYRPSDPFYMTDAFGSQASQFIQGHPREKPFFMYLAFTAPHWPLHAPQEVVERWQGKFMEGWDTLRAQRFRRMNHMGLLTTHALSDRYEEVPPWESLSPDARSEWDLKMALYASVMEKMDGAIGQVIQTLRTTGQLEHTLILFMSDNGACHEVMPPRNSPYPVDGFPGGPRSFPSYDPPWANLSNTPFRLYKSWTHEGGIATPLIAYWPGKIASGGILHGQTGHIIDVLPTCMEAAGIPLDALSATGAYTPIQGNSLLPWLTQGKPLDREYLFWEHMGNRAVRKGDWKLVETRATGEKPATGWMLYDLKNDPSEIHDVARQHPDKVAELAAAYAAWAAENKVLSPQEFREYASGQRVWAPGQR